MESDIVAQLRVFTDTLLLGDFQGLAATTTSAADEIERLREALRLEQEELAACCIDRRETQRERDEARRKFCEMCASVGGVYRRVGRENVECRTAEEIAEICGWDCYKEATDGE